MAQAKQMLASLLISLAILCSETAAAQLSRSQIEGRILDELGATIAKASITLIDAAGAEKKTTTDENGRFRITDLPQGVYRLSVTALGFAAYQIAEVRVGSATTKLEDIILKVEIKQDVTISANEAISTDPANNASAITLRGTDIEALPDDPDELTAALEAIAGPGAGPEGSQLYIDGFSGGRMPPRESIREIRINQNPFSAEYDRPGFGRIEVITKPGTEEMHGEFSFEFEDESLNSRNPFALNRAPFQIREYGANIGGPIIKEKASFFADFERSETDDNAIISAIVLGDGLSFQPFNLAVLTPRRETEFSPRVDWLLNKNNTLTLRYEFEDSSRQNAGVGGFNLLSRAFQSAEREHTLRVTETAIINQAIVNETRFQYIRNRSREEGDNSIATVRVLDAFTGGGAQVGASFANRDRWELQNNTSWSRGAHAMKAGVRLRGIHLRDFSPRNFGGTFTFTSLEQYRDALVSVAGASPTQFTIAGGDPLAEVSQVDSGFYFQDDWRLRQNLTLSFGLRYENQTNISSHMDFSPRVGFAWSPHGASGEPKTVVRGGLGVFYNRISEGLTLDAERFNGINQKQFVVTDPTILSQVVFTPDGRITNAPTIDALDAFALPQTIRLLDGGIKAPRMTQAAISVERQLPHNTIVSASFVHSRSAHLLRSRSVTPSGIDDLIPEDVEIANVFRYESSGRFRQNQLLVNFRTRVGGNISVFANYTLNNARSDTDGAGMFPANSDDLSLEYGRSRIDIRHQFTTGGSIELPWDVRLNPFIVARSGAPFNITTGSDTNGDTLFTERPALADDLSRPSVVVTEFGAFDLDPLPGKPIIPRNFGEGPGFFQMNLRINKEFGFGGSDDDDAQSDNQERRDGRGRGGSSSDSKFNVELSLSINNILNSTNFGLPIGNLSSPLFGRSTSTIAGFGFGGGRFGQSPGNRRIEFEIEFNF